MVERQCWWMVENQGHWVFQVHLHNVMSRQGKVHSVLLQLVPMVSQENIPVGHMDAVPAKTKHDFIIQESKHKTSMCIPCVLLYSPAVATTVMV